MIECLSAGAKGIRLLGTFFVSLLLIGIVVRVIVKEWLKTIIMETMTSIKESL